jgi:group I intron endonuclease
MLVYLLLNHVNFKSYIGQTRHHTLSKRWNKHLNNVTVNQHLTSAIHKYGAESFSRKILCHASCQQELDLLEQFWIAFYRSNESRYGYNMQGGGLNWRGEHTPEVKRRIQKAAKRMWARKSPKEHWEFQFATKLRWLSRTEEERQAISQNITLALLGKPRTDTVWNKGISTGRNGRKGMPSARQGRSFGRQQHPCLCWPPKTAQHRQHISEGLMKYFQQRGLPPKKPCGRVKQPYQNRLESPADRKETRAMIALKEMERANHKLREIKGRLDDLKFELQGGCTW